MTDLLLATLMVAVGTAAHAVIAWHDRRARKRRAARRRSATMNPLAAKETT